ncbi:MAG: hypothetical protein ACRDZ5_06115, partial [Acidimicrobiales bacterium]
MLVQDPVAGWSWDALTAGEAARELQGTLARDDDTYKLPPVIQLINDCNSLPPTLVPAQLSAEPPQISPRWDALLAGVTEDICLRLGLDPPAWVFQPERYLAEWWYVGDLRSFHGMSMATAPAA